MKRIIAFLLVLSLTITTLNLNPVKAADTSTAFTGLGEFLCDEMTTQEALSELFATERAGDWYTAHYIDQLPWNFFHNLVEEDIVAKGMGIPLNEFHVLLESNSIISKLGTTWKAFHSNFTNNLATFQGVTKEVYLPTVLRSNGKTGPGRVDIMKKDGYKIEIWEIKPYSYAVDSKKKVSAKLQLDDYADTMRNYDIRYKGFPVFSGGTTINGATEGDIYVTPRLNVAYKIHYSIGNTPDTQGLIIYTFQRQILNEETYKLLLGAGLLLGVKQMHDYQENEKLPGRAIVGSSSYALLPAEELVIQYAFVVTIPESMRSEETNTNTNQESADPDVVMSEDTSETTETENPRNNIIKNIDPKEDIDEIDLSPLVPYVTLAIALVTLHSAVQSGEYTRNSLSKFVLAGATTFIVMLKAELGADTYQKLVRAGQGKKEDLTYQCSASKAQMLENILADFEEVILAVGTEELIEDALYITKEKDKENIRKILDAITGEEDEYNRASKQVMPKDPLVIDLGEPGINITTLEDGVNFDLDNNGFAEKIEWINEDGFLVIDRNNNQKIDNGTELFTDGITLQTGENAKTGFEMLAEYDDNKDSKIDENDEVYPRLQVWVDSDQNGISSPDELKSLTSLGIESIDIAEDGEVRYTDDRDSTVIKEMWFNARTAKTIKNGYVTFGNVEELTTYIFENNDTQTYEDLKRFAKATDITHKRYYARKILYTITGADKIEKISYGKNLDSRQLRVIESFMGRAYEGADGAVPNAKAAEILSQIYDRLEDNYYILLCSYAGSMSIISLLSSNTDMLTKVGEKLDEVTLYDATLFLKSQSYLGDESGLNETLEYLNTFAVGKKISEFTKSGKLLIAEGGQTKTTYTASNALCLGSESDDQIQTGKYIDEICGGAGNDILMSGAGCDTLIGGTGNDTLKGETGNDTYVFSVGDGDDTIYDFEDSKTSGKQDRICFTEGITPDSVNVYRNNYDMVIEYGDNDRITVQRVFIGTYGYYVVEYIEFADGTVWDIGDITEMTSKRHGTEGDDTISGYNSIIGYSSNETMYGHGGNDTLNGGAGCDTLIGGTGNDTLKGETGNDTYVFSIGDGYDTIYDFEDSKTSGKQDRICFTEGITPDSVNVYRSNYDMVIEYGDSDRITVQRVFIGTYGYYEIEYIEFADGTIWDVMKDLEL